MSSQNLRRGIFNHVLTAVALSVASTVIHRVGVPIKIVRFGVVVTTAIDSTATGYVYALDRRVLVGSDTGRVEMARMTGAVAEDAAIGKVIEAKVGTLPTSVVASDGSTVVSGGVDGHVCNIGDEIMFEVITAADTAAGAGQPFFEYILLGEDDGSQTDRIKK